MMSAKLDGRNQTQTTHANKSSNNHAMIDGDETIDSKAALCNRNGNQQLFRHDALPKKVLPPFLDHRTCV